MVDVRIENCPYCGSKELGWGYQSAQGAVMPGRSGFAGSKVEHLICTDCGSIVHSRVAKPELFKNIVREKTTRKKRKENRNSKALIKTAKLNAPEKTPEEATVDHVE